MIGMSLEKLEMKPMNIKTLHTKESKYKAKDKLNEIILKIKEISGI